VGAIVGPTAVGKSAVALAVARALEAEIVSIDSMQIYRGMDIGTDKPSPEARREVPHHLVDVVNPSHDLTVAEFQARGRQAIGEVIERGRLSLLVGGSGLYFRAVVDDLEFPPRARAVRGALEAEAVSEGGAARLHSRLARLDPEAAARIGRANTRRVIRALEIIELTGGPVGDYRPWRRFESIYELTVAGLTRPRADLYRRIEERVERMLEAGLEDEAGRLAAAPLGSPARQALGYRQVLESPAAGRPELREAIVRATKRFARRQESWFRGDPRVVWFDASEPGVEARVAEFISAAAARPREGGRLNA
jgi:tRNA dimethylallyltransferase